MSTWKTLGRWAVLASAVACAGDEPSPETVKLVTDLTILAHASPPSNADAFGAATAIDDGRMEVDDYIEYLLDAPALGRSAKAVVLSPASAIKEGQPVPRVIMSSFEEDGQTIYTVGTRCAVDTAVEVKPWWNRNETILVCPHAYRPDKRTADDGRMCGATTMLPGGEEGCGCGPRLMWCVRDEEQHAEMLSALRKEVTDTVAYVVNQDLPLEQLFLMNGTVRNRWAETIYRRSEVLAGADPEVMSARGFGARSKLQPRTELVEGQHAGVLTAAGFIFVSDALRGVMREYYNHLWCARTSSSGVTTQRVLGLGVVDLRVGDGWQQLAAMDICTDCHARLDYGMQFFAGYPSSTMGVDFRVDHAKSGTGTLYGKHIGDARGVDMLTPQGFARLAVAQPEFAECMAQKVTGHVLGDQATPDDRDAVLLSFQDEHTYKAMMRTALKRFAHHNQGSGTPAVDGADDRAPRPGLMDDDDSGVMADAVAVPEDLLRTVDNHCAHCHDGIDNVDLTAAHQSRTLLNLMLEQVAFGGMPIGDTTFNDDDRDRFVEQAITTLWEDPAARDEARAFFVGGRKAHAAHGYVPVTRAVATRAGASRALNIRGLQNNIAPAIRSYTPGMAATVALVALDACKQTGATGAALEACVLEASQPERAISGSVE